MAKSKEGLQPTDIFTPSSNDGDEETAHALPLADTIAPTHHSGHLQPGERFGDFVVLRELGAGAFARVYLAHDVVLDRRVALKLSENRGVGEGQALAELDHQNIVKVYAQFIDKETGKHCLCLQYVPGTTLANVVQHLHRTGQPPVSGADILEAIGLEYQDDIPFDPAGLRDRQVLSSCAFASAVCRIGVQMAEATAFAHQLQVLHCDIKPANILVNPYGRPLLADFNVSVDTQACASTRSLGGTLGYMPPEQLALFLQEEPTQRMDERGDIYSIGVVLFEVLTGELPFKIVSAKLDSESRATLLKNQRAFSSQVSWQQHNIPPVVERVLRRALCPDPVKRYANAREFAQALSNAFDVLTIQQHLPAEGMLTKWAERWPVFTLSILTFLPHIIGSLVNIAYNSFEIRLNAEQRSTFVMTALVYNLSLYPVCILLMFRLILPVVSGWRRMPVSGTMTGEDIDKLRGRALILGKWGIILAMVGWLPGGIVFPLAIDLFSGGVSWEIYVHFIISFTLSGLIALIYSHFGIQFVVLRIFYPHLSNPDNRNPTVLARELGRASRWFVLFSSLAMVVPLAGALLLVVFTGEMTLSYRLLVVSLIVLGMTGVGIAFMVTRKLTGLIRLLSGERNLFPTA